MPLDPTSLLGRTPVIPVLTIESAAQAVPLARALLAGGLPVLEVTLRTAAALAAVKAIAAEVPEAVVGVGTVTSPADIEKAVAAGARFLVSPGTTTALADALATATVPALPGCDSVAGAMALAERGFRVLKFFPAEPSGGAAGSRRWPSRCRASGSVPPAASTSPMQPPIWRCPTWSRSADHGRRRSP